MIPEHIRDTIKDALGFWRDDAEENCADGEERGHLLFLADAALAWLKTLPDAPAPDWEPLPDGEYEMQGHSIKYILNVSNHGQDLEAWPLGDDRVTDEFGVGDYRLCRKRP